MGPGGVPSPSGIEGEKHCCIYIAGHLPLVITPGMPSSWDISCLRLDGLIITGFCTSMVCYLAGQGAGEGDKGEEGGGARKRRQLGRKGQGG